MRLAAALACLAAYGAPSPPPAARLVGGDLGISENIAAVAWPTRYDLQLLDGALRGGGLILEVSHEPTMEGHQYRFCDRGAYLYHCAY